MNQKHIGIILIIVSLAMAVLVGIIQIREEAYIQEIMETQGSCFLEDGTCLHARSLPLYVFAWAITGAIFLFGLYLAFFDKTQEYITEHQIKVSSALESASKKDEFKAYLSGFTEEEQKILSAVREQEGIKQSTLRYRTSMSKTSLSLLLKSLEARDIVSRKDSGKTKEVYLVKKF